MLFLMGATKKEMSMGDKRLAHYYKKIAGKNAIKPEGLGPTSNATAQHSLRVYYQVQVWKRNNKLNAEEWVWRKTMRGTLMPVAAVTPPVLQELLNIIKVSAKIIEPYFRFPHNFHNFYPIFVLFPPIDGT